MANTKQSAIYFVLSFHLFSISVNFNLLLVMAARWLGGCHRRRQFTDKNRAGANPSQQLVLDVADARSRAHRRSRWHYE